MNEHDLHGEPGVSSNRGITWTGLRGYEFDEVFGMVVEGTICRPGRAVTVPAPIRQLSASSLPSKPMLSSARGEFNGTSMMANPAATSELAAVVAVAAPVWSRTPPTHSAPFAAG